VNYVQIYSTIKALKKKFISHPTSVSEEENRHFTDHMTLQSHDLRDEIVTWRKIKHSQDLRYIHRTMTLIKWGVGIERMSLINWIRKYNNYDQVNLSQQLSHYCKSYVQELPDRAHLMPIYTKCRRSDNPGMFNMENL